MNTNIINIFIVIIGIIFLVYVVYLFYLHLQIKNKTVEYMNNLNNTKSSTVLILKTHSWNNRLEKFATKLLNETVPYNIDFYILMHSDDNSLINKIKNLDLIKHVLIFSQSDIKKMYDKGFYSMWLSNHWILMWFFRQFKYQYYWSMEYDVRISGDSSRIWTYNGPEDFLYPIQPFQDRNWIWKNHYSGSILNDDNKFYGYLQLARYSLKFLNYLEKYFQMGENGQDEMIVFSLYKKGSGEINLTGNHELLSKLINNSWSVNNKDSDKHRKMLIESNQKYLLDKNHLKIFHPLK